MPQLAEAERRVVDMTKEFEVERRAMEAEVAQLHASHEEYKAEAEVPIPCSRLYGLVFMRG